MICPQVWRPNTSCIHSWVLLGARGTWKPQVIVFCLFFTTVENVSLNFPYNCLFKVSWYWRSGWDGQGLLVRPKDGLLGSNHCWLKTCFWSSTGSSWKLLCLQNILALLHAGHLDPMSLFTSGQLCPSCSIFDGIPPLVGDSGSDYHQHEL